MLSSYPAGELVADLLSDLSQTGSSCVDMSTYLAPVCHLRTIAQLCRATSLQLRHVSTIGKQSVKQQYVANNMVNFDPLAAEIGLPVWGIPANFNSFASWQSGVK